MAEVLVLDLKRPESIHELSDWVWSLENRFYSATGGKWVSVDAQLVLDDDEFGE